MMIIDDNILKFDEKISYLLRCLYDKKGYSQFKMSKFEEYDLYMKNKDFLVSDGIITFNDTNGRLLALKPDVTLSIVKNTKDVEGYVQKVYYNENVYRISESSSTYKEIMQSGVECIGDITDDDCAEVVKLALESASVINENYRFQLSHIGFVNAYLADFGIDIKYNTDVCNAIFDKNLDALKKLCSDEQYNAFSLLVKTYNNADDVKNTIVDYCKSDKSKAMLDEFVIMCNRISNEKTDSHISIDFSLTNSISYYSGIVFKAYISGIAKPILSGGQYDELMKKLGRRYHAIGFAVYLDELEQISSISDNNDEYINVALPKGRLGEKVYAMFEKAGFDCDAIKENNRKLIFENSEKKVRYFWVKPSDVSIYVERGAADIGVAGKDILLEYEPDVYELCDLNIGKCRMAVAAKKDFVDDKSRTLRVATKFSNIAQKFYAEKCRDIDIIHLNGSIEIAPILGLSDVIVDIVETGKTLLENDLEPFEDIVPISARLISNKSSYQFKKDTIEKIRAEIAKQVINND